MKEIRLTNGGVTLVDDEDYRLLSTLTWQACDGRYVTHHEHSRGHNRLIRMHNMIALWMGLEIPAGHEVDHKNRDGLDNQRHNLRVVTRSLNCHNTGLRRNNTT